MPFILNEDQNEVTFNDSIANCKITLYYRLPTSEERTAYSNALILRKKKKVESKIGEARLKYGLTIMTGFKERDFALDKNRPISSDPESPLYNPNWKGLVVKYASHLIMALAAHVYESVDEEDETEEPQGLNDEGEESPLSGISMPS